MLAPLRGAVAAAALIALVATGCGDDEPVPGVAGTSSAAPGTGGTLVYALAAPPRELDPLLAKSRPDQLLTRQIHEPLVETLRGPFDDVRRERGLARSWRPSRDREIWRFELRRGIRFQDGTPFNAAVVLANVERWRAAAAGRALLPELLAADAPRPDLVRFILSRPVRDLPGRLASPRLGIVSPEAAGRLGTGLAREDRSGTGPYELRERAAGTIVIARNVAWWGTRADLGPALDQIELRVVRSGPERLALLREGTVQAADALSASAVSEIRGDPLLTYVGGSGEAVLGLERSVRGIRSASAIVPFSGVWLTTVGVE